MVGHTGVYDAAVKAVGTIYDACEKAGYVLMITADHGNAEQMISLETGAPHTAHTTNKVPFILTGKGHEFITDDEDGKDGTESGALCGVASTVLAVIGLSQPEGKWMASEMPPSVLTIYYRDNGTFVIESIEL